MLKGHASRSLQKHANAKRKHCRASSSLPCALVLEVEAALAASVEAQLATHVEEVAIATAHRRHTQSPI